MLYDDLDVMELPDAQSDDSTWVVRALANERDASRGQRHDLEWGGQVQRTRRRPRMGR